MKSALELAMEKADNALDKDEDYVKLKPEQVKAIEEIKKLYQARWAEQEIVLQGKIQQLASQTDPRELAEHRSQFQQEMNQVRERIFAERDAKIEEIRQEQK